MIDRSYIFFAKAVLFGVVAVITVPREKYKHFALWGFVFGVIGNLVQVVIFPMFHLMKYSNMGNFDILGRFSFWTPFAWMFAFMVFFRFLPVRKLFLALYILGFSIFGFMVGWVLQNFELYFYLGKYVYFSPLVYGVWFSLGAWAYIRSEKIVLK